MVKNPRFAVALAVVVAAGVVTFSMWTRHSAQPVNPARVRAEVAAPQLDEGAIARALRANNIAVAGLTVRSLGGIVILRGDADPAAAERATAVVKALGATRVANLINTKTISDEELTRQAERELAGTNSLAGCTLKVHCEKGVLSVTGTVQQELQKDAARSALRAVTGAREVRVDLSL